MSADNLPAGLCEALGDVLSCMTIPVITESGLMDYEYGSIRGRHDFGSFVSADRVAIRDSNFDGTIEVTWWQDEMEELPPASFGLVAEVQAEWFDERVSVELEIETIRVQRTAESERNGDTEWLGTFEVVG